MTHHGWVYLSSFRFSPIIAGLRFFVSIFFNYKRIWARTRQDVSPAITYLASGHIPIPKKGKDDPRVDFQES